MAETDYAVAVLAVTPQGVPLIRDFTKPAPIYWKLPGGRNLPNESAEACAVRELKEETGVVVKPENLRLLHKESRGNHTFVLFRTDLRSEIIPKSEDENEEASMFASGELLSLPDFFPPHREILRDVLI